MGLGDGARTEMELGWLQSHAGRERAWAGDDPSSWKGPTSALLCLLTVPTAQRQVVSLTQSLRTMFTNKNKNSAQS